MVGPHFVRPQPDVVSLRRTEALFTSELKRGDGVYLELGQIQPSAGADGKIVIIPYTDKPGVEHKWALTVYTDVPVAALKPTPKARLFALALSFASRPSCRA